MCTDLDKIEKMIWESPKTNPYDLSGLYVREGEHLSTVSLLSAVSFSEAHSL
jgi:hypothetical protein